MELAAVLDEAVTRIVAQCHPEKIILFGSRARGPGGAASDLDLMVVTAGRESKRQQTVALYRALRDLGVPKDIVVIRPEEFERTRDLVGTLVYPAVREGRVLYDCAA